MADKDLLWKSLFFKNDQVEGKDPSREDTIELVEYIDSPTQFRARSDFLMLVMKREEETWKEFYFRTRFQTMDVRLSNEGEEQARSNNFRKFLAYLVGHFSLMLFSTLVIFHTLSSSSRYWTYFCGLGLSLFITGHFCNFRPLWLRTIDSSDNIDTYVIKISSISN